MTVSLVLACAMLMPSFAVPAHATLEAGFSLAGPLLTGDADDNDDRGLLLSRSGSRRAGRHTKAAKEKSPWVAGALGGILGLGTGQYYAKSRISGTVFLAVDALSIFLLASGISAMEHADEEDSLGGGFADTIGGSSLAALGSLGIVASHVVQAITGPVTVHLYNKRVVAGRASLEPFILPTRDDLRVGLCLHY
jgi:hypothetical protein